MQARVGLASCWAPHMDPSERSAFVSRITAITYIDAGALSSTAALLDSEDVAPKKCRGRERLA